MAKYSRVLIKLSGRAMAGDQQIGFHAPSVEHIVREVLVVVEEGVEVTIVVGGGNFFRGQLAADWGIERAEADQVGMLGTVLNALMLRGAFGAQTSREVRVMTAVPMEAFAEPYIRLRAIQHLKKGYLVILAAGIGQPYLTTDYPAVQRAVECRCDAILVAKHGVDGVYTADPGIRSDARRFETLAYDDFIRENLTIVDHSAVLLAKDQGLPMHIFNFDQLGAMKDLCMGRHRGTYVAPGTTRKLADE